MAVAYPADHAAGPNRARTAGAHARCARGEPRPPPRGPRRGAGGRGEPDRVPGAGLDRVPAAGPCRRGGDAARRSAPDLPGGRHARHFDRLLVRRGVGGPPTVHRRGTGRGRCDPPRAPQAVPADLRAVRRATLLCRGRHAAGRAIGARRRDRPWPCARTSGTSRSRSCSRSTGRRSSSTCRRPPAATWRRQTRWGSAPRRRGER